MIVSPNDFSPRFLKRIARCAKKFTRNASSANEAGWLVLWLEYLWFSSRFPEHRLFATHINSVPKLSSISAIGGGRKQRRQRKVPHATKRLARIEVKHSPFFFLSYLSLFIMRLIIKIFDTTHRNLKKYSSVRSFLA